MNNEPTIKFIPSNDGNWGSPVNPDLVWMGNFDETPTSKEEEKSSISESQLITFILKTIGVLGEGQLPTAEQYNHVHLMLGSLITPLWKLSLGEPK